MKKAVQHPGEAHYGMGPPSLKTSHSDGAGGSNVGALPHYQQAPSVKWMQDSVQGAGWSQEASVQGWGQNFAPYIGGVNVRGQMGFHKGTHDGVSLQIGAENQLPAPVEVYRDATQAQSQGRGLEWEQHAAAAMHQAQLQAYHHKGMELQSQPPVPSHTLQGQVLQPFQASFGPNKQQFPSEYYPVFPGNKAVQSLVYGEQPKTQQQLLHQMQQQQMHHHHQQQQQQHQLQLQQHQMQQQQMQQMQQQYHQQQIQEQQQQMQQMQQLQQQNVPQQEPTQPPVQSKQQQTQNFGAYPHPELQLSDSVPVKEEPQSVLQQPETPTCDASPAPDQYPEDPTQTPDAAQAAPRRSRRLSREGQSPLGPPPANLWPKEPPPSLNGAPGVPAAKGGGGASQVATGGVIQNNRRRRRASKEINLETLAQKASEMESLPAKTNKQEDGASGKQPPVVPLVIPVSVPVPRSQMDPQGGWAQASLSQREWSAGQSDRKPSVIVARRRSRRNSVTESFSQDGENDSGADEDGKSKFKRRPRPEPLIIPPPKASSFIPPSLYPSITSYQSNLRSPVRLPENLHAPPPYTPPPILSPVRGGSGLYFSAFLTNMASNQILPPPVTPKSATRSLLRTVCSDSTPPVLPIVTDAAPVSLEPRINIGPQYQAEIPDLQNPDFAQNDQHQADLLWLPLEDSNHKNANQHTMEHFMNLACSSVLEGGGTNQELVLHCLHESGGNLLETLERLMLQEPIFPVDHHLKNYHYSGSDRWTREEKRYFNKGISAYRKDFFLVQTLVQTKTVAQCVEFYYTYKKQVKIGRNSILTFGPPDSPSGKHTESVVDVKSSQLPKETQEERQDDGQKEKPYESHERPVDRSLQVHDYAGTVLVFKEPEAIKKEPQSFSVSPRNRAEPTAKKAKPQPKPPQDPNAVFPCKKCGRVFSKVKSRSAHMKSHAEQEKKAAALRQKQEEEQAAIQAQARKAAASAAAAAAAHHGGNGNGWMQQAEISSQDDSSEAEDDNDADWQ
ncbi:ELM2 and SANT domain-containing protein 1 isoform X3 [Oryzias latipes]|nr:ELM2 and SANT domain-containing protein 1 isoform X3 [Oryzias latipes]